MKALLLLAATRCGDDDQTHARQKEAGRRCPIYDQLRLQRLKCHPKCSTGGAFVRRMARLCGTVLAVLAVGGAAPAMAWQPDVHYGLTEYAALSAGFDAATAEEIAKATQAPDDCEEDTAVYLMTKKILLGANESEARAASARVHLLHFASWTGPPASAEAREVKEVLVGDLNSYDRALHANSMKELGNALHALQDSVSHQGIPSVPWPLWRTKLQWAHPKARGGPISHKADTTWKQEPAELDRVMRATRSILVARRSAAGYGLLSGDEDFFQDIVKKCAEAESYEGKKVCFKDSNAVDPAGRRYRDRVSVSDWPEKLRQSLKWEWDSGHRQRTGRSGAHSSTVRDAFQRFLEKWILEKSQGGNVDKALFWVADGARDAYGNKLDSTLKKVNALLRYPAHEEASAEPETYKFRQIANYRSLEEAIEGFEEPLFDLEEVDSVLGSLEGDERTNAVRTPCKYGRGGRGLLSENHCLSKYAAAFRFRVDPRLAVVVFFDLKDEEVVVTEFLDVAG